MDDETIGPEAEVETLDLEPEPRTAETREVAELEERDGAEAEPHRTLTDAFVPSSIDRDRRTAEVVWTTGADVVRMDWETGTEYVERLQVSAEAVDLSRLKAGAPLLDSHETRGVRNTLGVVEDAWIENGLGLARVRFSKRAADVFEDVADGITRKISVGYTRQAKRELEEAVDGIPVHEIVRWAHHELSFVTVPADNGAQVRKKVEKMEQETKREATVAPETKDAPPVDKRAEINPEELEAARAAERERVADILGACERVKLPSSFARSLIEEGLSVADARARIIEKIADEPTNTAEVDHRFEPGSGEREAEFRDLAVRGLLHRANVERTEAREALELAHLPLWELARRCAEMDGIRIDGRTPNQIVTRAITSTTLADTVALTASRTLVKAYEGEPRTFAEIFREETAQNFRTIYRVKLSDAPKLDLVAEGADYTEGTLSDEAETYTVQTYGKILPFTRQMMVNDDLRALTRIVQMFGASAAQTEGDVAWGVINTNGNMADGTAIFAAGRGNLVTSTPLSAAALEAAREHFRGVTAPNGTKLNLMPRYLVVGPDLEIDAEKLLRPPADYQTGTLANTLATSLRNSLMLVVEPRINTGEWFLFCDNARIDTAEYSYLAGQRGPFIDREVDFTSKAIKFSATDDFGAGVIEWRGMYKGQAGA